MTLKEIIISKGIKRTAIAAKLGVSKQAVYQWENCRIPPERIPELARFLGVSQKILKSKN